MKITLVALGHVEKLVDIQKIKKWKSKIFDVVSIQTMNHLPESDVHDGYLDHKYSQDALTTHIHCPENSDLAIAIMPNRFEDGFYLHRLSENCVGLSLYGINDILSPKHISLENFILKQIYEICALKILVNDFHSDEVYTFVHTDTRGCLFDLNGDKQDIIYNTEMPAICESCTAIFKKKQLEDNYYKKLLSELKRLKKPRILRIENFIKKYPLLSVILSALLAIIINLISNMIFEKIK